MQADRAAGQTRQCNSYRGARLDREFEPFLLEDVGDELLGLRCTGYRLRLRPVQVGCGERTAIGKLGRAVGARGGRRDPKRLRVARGDLLIEDHQPVRVGCDRERAEIGAASTEGARMAGFVSENINGVILIRLRLQHSAEARAAAIRCSQGQYWIVLVVVGTRDETHVIERHSITSQIDIQFIVGEDDIAKDSVARAGAYADSRALVEGNRIVRARDSPADGVAWTGDVYSGARFCKG